MKLTKVLICLVLYLTLALSIAFLPGSCDRAQGETTTVLAPDTRTFTSNGRTYEATVIADLSQYLKEHGDDSALLRFVDYDAHTVIYVLLNDTGEMFTGLQVVPTTALSTRSPLWKRQWRQPLATWGQHHGPNKTQ